MGVSRLLTPADPSFNFRVTNSSSIKRIVVTSSTVAVDLTPRAGHQHTENEWNEAAVKEVSEQGKQASGFSKYSASKTLAESSRSGP